jgi:hypothetical protein
MTNIYKLCLQHGANDRPVILEDKDHPETFLCFFKQNGVFLSVSTSGLRGSWAWVGSAEGGENVCCLVDTTQDDYVLFHSPANGVGVKRSADPRAHTKARALYGSFVAEHRGAMEEERGRKLCQCLEPHSVTK